jgi:hypothetical protein
MFNALCTPGTCLCSIERAMKASVGVFDFMSGPVLKVGLC